MERGDYCKLNLKIIIASNEKFFIKGGLYEGVIIMKKYIEHFFNDLEVFEDVKRGALL
jgi:hypothetical protein